jgi:hypothetical protein
MGTSDSLTPAATIATAYFVVNFPAQVVQTYCLAQQPVCSMAGVNQTVTPQPSPSR